MRIHPAGILAACLKLDSKDLDQSGSSGHSVGLLRVCVCVWSRLSSGPSQPVNKPDAALTAQRTKHKSAFHGVNNIHDLGADLSGRTSVGGPQQPDSSAVCVFDGVAH